jgi:hypothetical protein
MRANLFASGGGVSLALVRTSRKIRGMGYCQYHRYERKFGSP